MGLSQLSFAASTLTPANTRNHELTGLPVPSNTHALNIQTAHAHSIPHPTLGVRNLFEASPTAAGLDITAPLRNSVDVRSLQMNGVKMEKDLN